MITMKMRARRLGMAIAAILEGAAWSLRFAVQRKPRPKPLAFPTPFEQFVEKMNAANRVWIEREIEELAKSPMWPERLITSGRGGAESFVANRIGGSLRIRVPGDYDVG